MVISDSERPSSVVSDEALMAALPGYYRLVGQDLFGIAKKAWNLQADQLRLKYEEPILIFCHPDGTKSLMIQRADHCVVGLFRSGLVDDRHLRVLSVHVGCDSERLREKFEHLPVYNAENVRSFVSSVRTAEEKEGVEKSALKELNDAEALALTIAERYNPNNEANFNEYAVDIRVFSLLQSLRRVMLGIRAHLLVVDDESAGDLTRLYVNNTSEGLPQRPPIFASVGADRFRAPIVRRLEKEGEVVKMIEPGDTFLSSILKLEGVNFDPSGSTYSALIRSPDGRSLAVLELQGEKISQRDVEFVRDAARAAIDRTDNSAVKMLVQRAKLANRTQYREFRALTDIFERSLVAAGGQAPGQMGWWGDLMPHLRQILQRLAPGSLSESNVNRLRSVIQLVAGEKGSRGSSDVAADVKDGLQDFEQLLFKQALLH